MPATYKTPRLFFVYEVLELSELYKGFKKNILSSETLVL